MAHASRGSPNSRGSRPPGSPESNDSMSETRLSGLGQGTREARSSSLGILRQEDRRTGGQEDRREGWGSEGEGGGDSVCGGGAWPAAYGWMGVKTERRERRAGHD